MTNLARFFPEISFFGTSNTGDDYSVCALTTFQHVYQNKKKNDVNPIITTRETTNFSLKLHFALNIEEVYLTLFPL